MLKQSQKLDKIQDKDHSSDNLFHFKFRKSVMLQVCEDYGKQNSCQTKGRMTTGTEAIVRILPLHYLNYLKYALIRKAYLLNGFR